jgi:hypothetical protein
MLMLAAVPAAAQWGSSENSAAAGLLAGRAEISVISGLPLVDMLAAREKASLPVTIASTTFLATVVFDDNWDTWFALKPAEGPGAGAWKETDLASGAVYNYKGKAFLLKAADGVVSITSGGEKLEVSVNALFDKLYADSFRITFGGVITYAMFRNLAPLSESEGTAALRLGSDGLYYYSVTPDAQIEAQPRWLLAINWVLYGLRVQDGSLLFVSKPIEQRRQLPPRAERVRLR